MVKRFIFSMASGALVLASSPAMANTIQCTDASSGLKMTARMVTDTSAADIVVGHDGSMESLGALEGVAPPERNSPCGPGLYAYKSGASAENGVLLCLPNYLVSRGYEHFQGMIAFRSIDPRIIDCALSKTDLL